MSPLISSHVPHTLILLSPTIPDKPLTDACGSEKVFAYASHELSTKHKNSQLRNI